MSADLLPLIIGTNPVERLQSLRDAVDGRIVFTTSFGIEAQALTHMIAGAGLDIELATLDTGRLFPSTYKLWAETEQRYGLKIQSFHPDPGRLARFIAEKGVNGFYDSRPARESCCDIRKVEPMERALAGASAWVAGLRADQSDARSGLRLATWDGERGLIKVTPLFDWTREAIADFCAAHDVPINPLHAKGFPSIGCEPCTRAILPGENERAGRWWWENDEVKECGLHVDASGRLVRRAA